MHILARIRKFFRDDETHFVQLTEHFFQRFFDNELIAQGSEALLTVVHILALLAMPPVIYSLYQLPTYSYIYWFSQWKYEQVSLMDHCRFIILSMAIIGFVAVLEWDALFLDARDFAILIPLPLKASTVFRAKITALLLFLSLFIGDVGGIPTLLYPVVESTGIPAAHVSLLRLCRMIFAHGIAIGAASAFTFLFIVALQGLLINALSPRAFKKISLGVQVDAMIALLLLLFLLPTLSDLPSGWQQAPGARLLWFPPLWFLGLYQTLLGSSEGALHTLAGIAIVALAVVAFACAAAYALNYRRHMQQAVEASAAEPSGPSRMDAFAIRAMNVLLLRKPRERAAFYFVSKTIARSGKHRLYLAAYVGTGLALALFGTLDAFVYMSKGDLIAAISQPHEALLAIPLIVSFFVLSGMRMIFTIPAELSANWVFQLAEDENRAEFLRGARKAMLVPVVMILAALFPIFSALWGWRPALMNFTFSLVLSVILAELLFLNFLKIPFTCSFQSGKANITLLGVFYWFAFTAYAYTMATVERWLLQDGTRWLVFMVVALLALAALVLRRNVASANGFSIMYEDTANPEVQTLDLNG